MVVRGVEGHPRCQKVGGKTQRGWRKHVFIHNKLHCLQNVWLSVGTGTSSNILLNIFIMNNFVVELDQHFAMAVRFTPAAQHFVLQVGDALHHLLIASDKLFKHIVGNVPGEVSLIGVPPHRFFSSVVLDIFVDAWTNVFMIVFLHPFLEGVESIPLSLIFVDTSKNWRSHPAVDTAQRIADY